MKEENNNEHIAGGNYKKQPFLEKLVSIYAAQVFWRKTYSNNNSQQNCIHLSEKTSNSMIENKDGKKE